MQNYSSQIVDLLRTKQKQNVSINKIEKRPLIFRILIIGDRAVGCSSIMTRYIDKKFKDNQSTYQVSLKIKLINPKSQYYIENGNMNQKRQIHVHFREPQQSSYDHNRKNVKDTLLQQFNGIIFVFDTADIKSFQNIKNYWIPQVLKGIKQETKLFLLCNKIDLQRKIFSNDVEELIKKYQIQYQQVSALTGLNIEKALSKFTLKTIQTMIVFAQLKDIYMNMLLFLNQDFDDDLLDDIIKLLIKQQ